MIRCNLSVLLAERGLKITKVSDDTGISRTTLTALTNNRSDGVQFFTLNKLCRYLEVTPGEIISFIPIEITPIRIDQSPEITDKGQSSQDGIFVYTLKCVEHLDLACSIGASESYFSCSFLSHTDSSLISNEQKNEDYIQVKMCLSFVKDADSETSIERFSQLFRSIPRVFLNDIETNIGFAHAAVSTAVEKLPREFSKSKIDYKITWPPELRGMPF